MTQPTSVNAFDGNPPGSAEQQTRRLEVIAAVARESLARLPALRAFAMIPSERRAIDRVEADLTAIRNIAEQGLQS